MGLLLSRRTVILVARPTGAYAPDFLIGAFGAGARFRSAGHRSGGSGRKYKHCHGALV
jgi:hypothetical protein